MRLLRALAEGLIFWSCLAVVGFALLVLAPAGMTTAVLP